jgi:hypothetical protein
MADPEATRVRFDLPATVDVPVNREQEPAQEHYLGLPPSLQVRSSPPRSSSMVKEQVKGTVRLAENHSAKGDPSSLHREDAGESGTPSVRQNVQGDLEARHAAELLPDHQTRQLWDGYNGQWTAQRLFGLARGECPELWYKFKRFETLSLLNLYHYQHELIELESKIYSPKRDKKASTKPGAHDGATVVEMRRLLREYCESAGQSIESTLTLIRYRRGDSIISRDIQDGKTDCWGKKGHD